MVMASTPPLWYLLQEGAAFWRRSSHAPAPLTSRVEAVALDYPHYGHIRWGEGTTQKEIRMP